MGYWETTHNECTIAGTQKTKQSSILMSRSFPAPDFIKTARGGKRSAIIIKTSLLSITLSWKGGRPLFLLWIY